MGTYRWKPLKENLLCTFAMYDLKRNPIRIPTRRENGDFCFDTEFAPACFLTKIMVPGFGGAYLFADNEGKGYEPDGVPRDFLYEAAKSRLKSVRDYLDNSCKKYGFVPKEAEKRLELGSKLLKEDVKKALCEILWAGEEAVLAVSQNIIARRGNRDNFCFGACMKGFTDGGETWKKAFLPVFGQGVIPLHWGCLEPKDGETHYEVVFEMLDWLKEHHIPVRGHALVWFCGFWEGQNWMKDLPYEEIRKRVVNRAEMLMKARPNAFDYVDFNEPLQNNPYNYTLEEFYQICKDVYDVVKQYSPQTKIMVNFCNEWQEKCSFEHNQFEENRKARASIGLNPYAPDREYIWSVDDFLERCREGGLKVDVLGLQCHDYPYELFGTMELLEMWHDKWNLPIHLTEVSAPSSMEQTPYSMRKRPGPVREYWHHPWDEQLQAKWYREFATLFYSLDYVECCVEWSLSDAPAQWADYLEGHINEMFRLQAYCYDGILDINNTPKPVYYALHEMTETWNLKTGEKLCSGNRQ